MGTTQDAPIVIDQVMPIEAVMANAVFVVVVVIVNIVEAQDIKIDSRELTSLIPPCHGLSYTNMSLTSPLS
jgi:hypothetical protein